MTERISDIGQNVLLSYFQTGSSSSSSYFHISFLITFLEEAMIRNTIIILRINYIIIMCINNNNNNNLWKNPKLHFALSNSRGYSKRFLRNL